MYFPKPRLLTLLLVSLILFAGLLTLLSAGYGRVAMAQAASPLQTPAATALPAPDAPARAAQPVTSAVLVSAMPAASQPQTVTVVGDDDPAAVNRFLRYLLAGYGPQSDMLTITVGALPADLPITLSVPVAAEVIGGYVRHGEYEDNLVILSSGGVTEELASTLQQSLLAQGYTTPAGAWMGVSGQVFLSSEPAMPSILCSPDHRYVLYHSGLSLAGEAPALRVTVNRSSAGDNCSPAVYPGEAMPAGILPQLAPPEGAQVRSSGMGGGGDFVSADAEIQSPAPVAELAAHYSAHLEAAGWELLDSSSAAAVAWSAWQFADEQGNNWTGTFYLVQKGNSPNTFLATLRADAQ